MATAEDFIAEIETILNRKVRAFGSAVDTKANVVFENFALEPQSTEPGRRTSPA